ncbi:DUF427 domain-containing protein [Salinisphaera sp.]|uniref:DUF427 domain-containing protein n=1 Tax=Salinisphaera sp. TaxID=1914330 RepID=UPI002D767282|nr:DUF427 domain-containing protein [Salinisphaera sp.]HET7313909.1 DUF427 domain-containing protein [Salinisphaera sp.]
MPERQDESRIATMPLTTPVNISADTRLIASTRRAVLLEERGHRPVLYVPRDDVAANALIESATRTRCPYKGEARYFHVTAGGQTFTDAAWAYDAPLAALEIIAGLVAFNHPAIRVDQLD